MLNLAPIVLFCFNRPSHLSLTLESLQKNSLAENSDLIIFSDGPRNDKDILPIKEVRSILKSIEGFKTITIVENVSNKGLADNIKTGLNQVFNTHEKVIVIEDDMIFRNDFLVYMNNALNIYSQDLRVMHVSGYIYPMETDNLEDTFFLKPTTCWGWATWKRSWIFYIRDSDYFMAQFTSAMILDFNLNQAYPYWDQIIQNKNKLIRTWAIFWYASTYLQDGLSLHPKHSFVQNIGNDGSGTNAGKTSKFLNSFELSISPEIEKIDIRENVMARQRLEIFFSTKVVEPFIRRLKRLTFSKLFRKLLRPWKYIK